MLLRRESVNRFSAKLPRCTGMSLCRATVAMLLFAAGLASGQSPAPAGTPPVKSIPSAPVAGQHPLISEVLYAVPKGLEGDADQSGQRSATGDEFIEIYNPHSTPIDLKGYVLSDAEPLTGPESAGGQKRGAEKRPRSRDGGKQTTPREGKRPPREGSGPGTVKPATPSDGEPDDGRSPELPTGKRSRLRFEFPALTLKPGEVAVVFNGFESRPKGAVGTKDTPAAKNEHFANAYVFTMGVTSQYGALANEGDCVTLVAPDGRAIQCVRWGEVQKGKKLESAVMMMEAPLARGSVTLEGQAFVAHGEVEAGGMRRSFSPGTHAGKPAPSAPKAPK